MFISNPTALFKSKLCWNTFSLSCILNIFCHLTFTLSTMTHQTENKLMDHLLFTHWKVSIHIPLFNHTFSFDFLKTKPRDINWSFSKGPFQKKVGYKGRMMVSNGNVKYNGCFRSLRAFVYTSVLLRSVFTFNVVSDAIARAGVQP